MPSILIEYSRNITPTTDIQRLVDVVHEAAIESGLFEAHNIRTRACSLDHYSIGRGDPRNGLVQITASIRSGRSDEVRQRLSERLLETARLSLADAFTERPVALYVEVKEMAASVARYRTIEGGEG